MKLNWSIRTKILVFILSVTLVTFIFTMGYVSINNRKIAIKNAETIALKTASESALKIEKKLSENMAVLRTLAQAFTVCENMEEQEWKPLFKKMYYKVYEKNEDLYKLWDSWEMKYFVPGWNKDYGRYTISMYRDNNKIITSESDRSLTGNSDGYQELVDIGVDMLLEPYWDEFVEDSEEQKFMTTLAAPIYHNGNYAGVVAADIIMEQLQQITDKITVNESTTAYLASNNGIFVAHPNKAMVGQTVNRYFTELDKNENLSQIIKKGIPKFFKAKDESNKNILIISSPIQVGQYESPWALILTIPYSSILHSANKALIITFIIGFLGVVLISIVIVFITKNLSIDLSKTKSLMKKLADGEIDTKEVLTIDRGDEIEDIAQALNNLKTGLNNSASFATELGKGILDSDFKPLSDKDVLGKSLLNMRDSLLENVKEDQDRKAEDEIRNWATHGLAKFGDILRTNTTNIKELAYSIMSNLIDYLEVNQGALFIIEQEEDQEPYLELKNAIAYGRNKYMQKRLAIGQSLVGRCAFEMKSIYMVDIPDNYIQIQSGLGTANPKELLLVPLIMNEEVYGVIELASFQNIKPYQIDFVEKLGESIASTIASVKTNEKTSLLLEQSKFQADELASQEEEMRQNLEELQATQEESARREIEMNGIINALGTTAFTVEYDLEGTILDCNDKYAEILGMPKEKIIGGNHRDGYDKDSEMSVNYNAFWNDLQNDISKKIVNKVTINNREAWIEENYTPITKPHESTPYKIFKIGFDITEQKQKDIIMREQEIRYKKERLLFIEYKEQISQLKNDISKAHETIESLKSKAVDMPGASSAANSNSQAQDEIVAHGDDLISWSNAYKMGIEEIDEQHEQLVILANTLNTSYIQGKNKKEIKENLRSFIDFASYHFGNEEYYFEEFNFGESTEHIEDHQKFLKELKQIQTAFNSNKIKELDDILDNIKIWINKHFTTIDVKYAELFKANGI